MTVDHTYKNSGVDTQKSDQIVEYIKKSAQMVSNFMFVVQASIGHNVLLLYFTIAAENACGSIANTALVSYLSLISSRFASSGSVYALLSSLTVANTLFLPIMSGFVVLLQLLKL